MGKKIISILLVILVGVVALSFTKNTIIKIGVENGVKVVTGLRLSIKSFDLGILKTLVGIEDMKLYNPPGFKDKVMLDMQEIYVDYNLKAALSGKIHLYEARINLKEFVVVKNTDGKLNLDALKSVSSQKKGAATETKEKGKAPEMQIDNLELKIGKVVYKDYSKGGKPSVQEFNINLDEKYKNIDNPNKLVSLIVVKALMGTTIAKLTNFDLKSLEGTLGDTLSSAQKVVGSATGVAQQVLSQATKDSSGVVQGAGTAVKDLTQAIKLPFGSKEEK